MSNRHPRTRSPTSSSIIIIITMTLVMTMTTTTTTTTTTTAKTTHTSRFHAQISSILERCTAKTTTTTDLKSISVGLYKVASHDSHLLLLLGKERGRKTTHLTSVLFAKFISAYCSIKYGNEKRTCAELKKQQQQKTVL